MQKMLVINIFILLTLGCASSPAQDKVNYYAIPSESNGILFRWDSRDISAHVNFYVSQDKYLDQVHTIALLPAGYAYEHEMDSANFPNKEWLDCFRESVKAKLIKGYSSKYVVSSVFDTTSDWSENVDSYSKHLKQVLIYSSLKAKNKEFSRKLLDSLNKLWYDPDLFVILPSAIDEYIDTSEFYRDNRIKNEYARWGGKAGYDSICDSITKIVKSVFSVNELYKLTPPPIAKNKCDSIYYTLDNYGRDLWYRWLYPNTSRDGLFYPYKKANYYTEDEKSKKQLSDAVFQCLDADAYVIIDVSYNKTSTAYYEKRRFEQSSQMFLKISIFGPEFNVLWSADFPISKQIKKDKYAYEIIDYDLAREGVRRTLLLLRPKK